MRWLSALVILCAGCGGSPPAKKAPPAEVAIVHAAPAPKKAPVLAPLPDRHAKLSFKLGELVPVPLVHGTISGEPTWMLLDSGAGTHFMSDWMAKRANVKQKKTKTEVADHARVTLNVTLADRSLITIEQWGRLIPGELLVVDGDEGGIAAKAGIGVVLSPQELEDDRAVILELDRGEIRTGSEAEAVKALAARKVGFDPDDIEFCHGVFSIAAHVEGEAVRLTVDTGSADTDLFSLTKPGRALSPKSVPTKFKAETASGPIVTRTYKNAKIMIGALKLRKDITLIPGAPEIDCPVDGVIGIDILRSCVLVFGSKQGKLRMSCAEK
ncbi:MAG: aspartyl protease family protein [Polyangiaceae bacterium]